jgi:hypothetical protein
MREQAGDGHQAVLAARAVCIVQAASAKDCAEQRKKDSVYPRSETEQMKKPEALPKKGAHDGTRTHVGMSKRLDLQNKEQESTGHQAKISNKSYIATPGWSSYKQMP